LRLSWTRKSTKTLFVNNSAVCQGKGVGGEKTGKKGGWWKKPREKGKETKTKARASGLGIVLRKRTHGKKTKPKQGQKKQKTFEKQKGHWGFLTKTAPFLRETPKKKTKQNTPGGGDH